VTVTKEGTESKRAVGEDFAADGNVGFPFSEAMPVNIIFGRDSLGGFSMKRVLIALVVFAPASTALGYIHVPPTDLKGVCKMAPWIRVLTVKDRNEEKGGVTFEVTETLRDNKRWKSGVTSFRLIVPPDASGGKTVLRQLKVGRTVVLFSNEGEGEKPSAFGYACFGDGWYSVHYSALSKSWLVLRNEPDLSTCYHGDVKELPGYVKSILDGKEVKVPTMIPKEKVDHFERAYQIDAAMKKVREEK
jgi:hypothetical protein